MCPDVLSGETVSHYRILEELGAGGMGVVFRAEDLQLGRPAALKFLSKEFSSDDHAVKRFRREARAASALNHPNICTIYEFGEHQGRQFIAMELLEGETLKGRIGGPLISIDEAVSIGTQVAQALASTHSKGIVHCDLKPSNLFITKSGLVKVLDFGLARSPMVPSDATTTSSVTDVGAGTLPYMAPEQVRSEPIDARADLYALGVVLYEMVTGQLPFRERTPLRLADDILHATVTAPRRLNSKVPAALEQTILKALEKNPERRYQHSTELLADLRRVSVPRARWRPAVLAMTAAAIIAAAAVSIDLAGVRAWLTGDGAPAIEALAVLPLQDLDVKSTERFLADGMTETLIAELAKIRALRVISRQSVMRYKGSMLTLPEIARELRVDAVLQGSVLQANDQVRIIIHLISTNPERHLWAETYDRSLTEVLTLQREVARSIAREVRVALTPDERARLAPVAPAERAAQEAYLRGRFHMHEATQASIQTAIRYFEQAAKLDARYAEPHAALADAYNLLGASYEAIPASVAASKAKSAAGRALELDPTSAAAHTALAYTRFIFDWDWLGAGKGFERAITLAPGLAGAHEQYAWYLSALGRPEQAAAQMARAYELDPLSPLIAAGLAAMHYYEGKTDLAITQLQQTLAREPDFTVAHLGLGQCYSKKKLYPQAIAEFERAIALAGRNPSMLASLAHALTQAGRRQDAAAILVELQSLTPVPSYHVATVLAAIGDRDQAFQWLDKAFGEHSSSLLFLRVDARLDTLRPEQRFRDLMKRMGLEPTTGG